MAIDIDSPMLRSKAKRLQDIKANVNFHVVSMWRTWKYDNIWKSLTYPKWIASRRNEIPTEMIIFQLQTFNKNHSKVGRIKLIFWIFLSTLLNMLCIKFKHCKHLSTHLSLGGTFHPNLLHVRCTCCVCRVNYFSSAVRESYELTPFQFHSPAMLARNCKLSPISIKADIAITALQL